MGLAMLPTTTFQGKPAAVLLLLALCFCAVVSGVQVTEHTSSRVSDYLPDAETAEERTALQTSKRSAVSSDDGGRVSKEEHASTASLQSAQAGETKQFRDGISKAKSAQTASSRIVEAAKAIEEVETSRKGRRWSRGRRSVASRTRSRSRAKRRDHPRGRRRSRGRRSVASRVRSRARGQRREHRKRRRWSRLRDIPRKPEKPTAKPKRISGEDLLLRFLPTLPRSLPRSPKPRSDDHGRIKGVDMLLTFIPSLADQMPTHHHDVRLDIRVDGIDAATFGAHKLAIARKLAALARVDASRIKLALLPQGGASTLLLSTESGSGGMLRQHMAIGGTSVRTLEVTIGEGAGASVTSAAATLKEANPSDLAEAVDAHVLSISAESSSSSAPHDDPTRRAPSQTMRPNSTDLPTSPTARRAHRTSALQADSPASGSKLTRAVAICVAVGGITLILAVVGSAMVYRSRVRREAEAARRARHASLLLAEHRPESIPN